MTAFDPGRHPGDLVSQSSARVTNGERLADNYADVVALGHAVDVQLLASIAIARVQQLEAERDAQSARVIDIAPARRRRANRPRWLSPVGA